MNFNDPRGGLPCDVSGAGGNDGGSGCGLGGYPEWWCNGTATAVLSAPDPTCVYSNPEVEPSGPGSSNPPCWKDLGLVGETLSDLGNNVEQIAATRITNAGEIAALDSDIDSEVDAEFYSLIGQLSPASAKQPGKPWFNGGHFNLVLQAGPINGILGNDFSVFQDLFGGGGFLGSHNDAIWGDAAKGDFTLHSHQNGNNTSGNFNFHFDLFNPLDVPVGTIGHLFGDVIGGHIGGRCLDPAWRYQ